MKESLIITTVCQELDYRERLGQCVYIRNNSGAIKIENRFFRFGKKGSADLLLFLPNGRTIFLEAKSDKGQLTENQKTFNKKISKLGYDYIIIKNPNDISHLFKK